MKRSYVLATLLGAAVIWATTLLGLWWFALVVGVVIGLAIDDAPGAVGSAGVAGVLGWALPLLWQAFVLKQPVWTTATIFADALGFGIQQALEFTAATLFAALVLCEAGAWVGTALRLLTRPTARA